MSDVAGSEVSDALVDTVSGATNGNPLFIRELTEHVLRPSVGPTGPVPPVPDGIRHTIDLRVAGLSTDAQTLLRGGAVLGQTFDVNLAGRLVGLDGEALLGAVEDTLLSGLLVEQTATVVAFSHGLDAALESASIDEAIACYERAISTWDEPTADYADTLVRLGSALTTVGR